MNDADSHSGLFEATHGNSEEKEYEVHQVIIRWEKQ